MERSQTFGVLSTRYARLSGMKTLVIAALLLAAVLVALNFTGAETGPSVLPEGIAADG